MAVSQLPSAGSITAPGPVLVSTHPVMPVTVERASVAVALARTAGVDTFQPMTPLVGLGVACPAVRTGPVLSTTSRVPT